MRHRRHHPAVRPSTTSWSRTSTTCSRVLHEAFYVATAGRPGPVVIDIPKDVQFAKGDLHRPERGRSTRPTARAPRATRSAIRAAIDLIAKAKRPIFYTGGGVINSGPRALEAAARARPG